MNACVHLSHTVLYGNLGICKKLGYLPLWNFVINSVLGKIRHGVDRVVNNTRRRRRRSSLLITPTRTTVERVVAGCTKFITRW